MSFANQHLPAREVANDAVLGVVEVERLALHIAVHLGIARKIFVGQLSATLCNAPAGASTYVRNNRSPSQATVIAVSADSHQITANGHSTYENTYRIDRISKNDYSEFTVELFATAGARQPMISSNAPLIVGIGGTSVPGSSTECALILTMKTVEAAGMRTRMFCGNELMQLPFYVPNEQNRTDSEHLFIASIREASGVVLASPGYHGSVSGLVKNAIDLIEETARDSRPYLDDLPVGLIATAYGWAATGSTIATLRTIVHALRGWPTPFAAAINSQLCKFDPSTGGCSEPVVAEALARVGNQVIQGVLKNLAALPLESLPSMA